MSRRKLPNHDTIPLPAGARGGGLGAAFAVANIEAAGGEAAFFDLFEVIFVSGVRVGCDADIATCLNGGELVAHHT